MDQIKKAEETRLAMIKEAQETLVILGAESVVSTVEVQNVITINKGKIVELTKEVEIDNTDYTTIEMLKQTIKDMNNNYNELEAKLAKALNRIAELEQAAVVVEEPVVEETKIAPKYLSLAKQEDNYILTDEDLLAHLYFKCNIPESVRNHELMDEIFKVAKKMWSTTYPKDQKHLDGLVYIVKIMANTKKLHNLAGVSKGYKIPEVIAVEEKLEQQRKEREQRKQEEQKKQESSDITASYKKIETSNSVGEYSYGLQGIIVVDNKEYTFKWTNAHINPCLYGCMDEKIINRAANYLRETKEWNTSNNEKFRQQEIDKALNVAYDFENNIVIYKFSENVFEGYTDKYAFVWRTNEEIPCGTPVKNALNKNYRKMNESWAPSFVERAQMIKEACMRNFPECFNVTNDTETTKEVITNTNDEIDPDDLLE
jgi:prefoldin subunit 5